MSTSTLTAWPRLAEWLGKLTVAPITNYALIRVAPGMADAPHEIGACRTWSSSRKMVLRARENLWHPEQFRVIKIQLVQQ